MARGEEGIGEDVTYDPVDHLALQGAGGPEKINGDRSFAELSELIGTSTCSPPPPPSATYRVPIDAGPSSPRRWIWRCARPAPSSPRRLAARPVPSPSSLDAAFAFGSEQASSIEPLLARLADLPEPAL